MYWDDFRKFIESNKATTADIRYWYNRKKTPRQISIFDRNIPRRRGMEDEVLEGLSGDTHWMNSHVGEAAFFGGEIPLNDTEWIYDEERHEFVKEYHRGAKTILRKLLDEGCVRRTPDVERFLNHPSGCPLPRLAAD